MLLLRGKKQVKEKYTKPKENRCSEVWQVRAFANTGFVFARRNATGEHDTVVCSV